MSVNRVCYKCNEEEPIRFNFGDNHEAEKKFHEQKYECGNCKAKEND